MSNFKFFKTSGYISLIRVADTNQYTLTATHELPIDAVEDLKKERKETLFLVHSIQVGNVRIPELAMYWFSCKYEKFFIGDDLFEFSSTALPTIIDSMNAHEKNSRTLQFIIPISLLIIGATVGIFVVGKGKDCQNDLLNQCSHRIK